MKQQCYIAFIYASWLILAVGFVSLVAWGSILQALLWAAFVVLFLRIYVRYFPAFSSVLGYGSVADQPADEVRPSNAKIILYTGIGCPFCPLVKRRLQDLRTRMHFEFEEREVTLQPYVLMRKGLRALPVTEIGEARLVGNATSEQLAKFIESHTSPR